MTMQPTGPEAGPLQQRFLAWARGSMRTEPIGEVIRKFDQFAQEMEEVAGSWAEMAHLCQQAANTLRDAEKPSE
jgi:hypothetical protein